MVHGAPDNAIVLSSEEACAAPRPPESAELVQKALEPTSAYRGEGSLNNEVKRVVSGRLSLMLGTELEDVSKVFGVSARTLKRHLSEEGISLRSIVEGVKLEEAKRLLSETDLQITEIADVLLYAHLPSFTRAFKRATGRAPSDFRDALRSLQS